jgi:hypothetical protein
MNENFEDIKKSYKQAIESGDKEGLNTIIDFHLRVYLQCQYEITSIGIQDAEALSTNDESISEGLKFLRQKKEFLENLVFNDDAWNEFSQKLKSRGNLNNLPQLIQNAD